MYGVRRRSNAAESLTRGTRVIVSGRLRQRSYETKEKRREADRLRDRGRRRWSLAAERGRQGEQGRQERFGWRAAGSGRAAVCVVPAAGHPAGRATRAAATAAGTPTRGRPTVPADTPTNLRSDRRARSGRTGRAVLALRTLPGASRPSWSRITAPVGFCRRRACRASSGEGHRARAARPGRPRRRSATGPAEPRFAVRGGRWPAGHRPTGSRGRARETPRQGRRIPSPARTIRAGGPAPNGLACTRCPAMPGVERAMMISPRIVALSSVASISNVAPSSGRSR